MKNYYKTLGLDEGASKEEIKAAYEKLSVALDPANNDNLDFFIEEFALLKEAYSALMEMEPKIPNKAEQQTTSKNDSSSIEDLNKQSKTVPRSKENSNRNINDPRHGNTSLNPVPNKTKKSKNKIYIFLLILVLGICASYLFFLNKVSVFESLIPSIEQEEMIKMEAEKNKWESKFRKDYPRLKSYYNDAKSNLDGNLNFDDAIVIKDTTISFLFFSNSLKFNSLDKNYFKCAYYHEINRYKKKYNKEFLAWFNKTRKRHKIKRSKVEELIQIVKNNPSNSSFPFETVANDTDKSCIKCISNYISGLELNQAAIMDFDNFVVSYFSTVQQAKKFSAQSFIDFMDDLDRYESNMSNSLRKSFYRKPTKDNPNKISLWGIDGNSPKKYPFLSKRKSQYKFKNLDVLGEISYSLTKEHYKESVLKQLVDDFKKQIDESYKTNSLYTGAQPYSYCYGRNPSCSIPNGYAECSFIDVRASSGSDVVVIIKKNSKVFAHAYIKAGGYYKFKLGNGVFQTFFYYGKGWNPDKYIKTSTCGKVIGGFVSNESLDKSDKISLFNSTMSYTLYTVTNGNFKPKPSNKNEAF